MDSRRDKEALQRERGDLNDLTRISGIGPHLATKLNRLGIETIAEIAALSDEQCAKINSELDFKGRITRDDWVGQAKRLLENSQTDTGAPSHQRRAALDLTPSGSTDHEREPVTKDDILLSARPPEFCHDNEPVPHLQSMRALDAAFRAQLARLTFSITPAGFSADVFDWLAHLAISPGKQIELWQRAFSRYMRFLLFLPDAFQSCERDACFCAQAGDSRFEDEAWRQWPFNVMHQWFLLNQDFWQSATRGIDGLSQHEQNALSFVSRQILDHVSPSNFILTNPRVLRVTLEQGGSNLVRGVQNAMQDWQRFLRGGLPVGAEEFVVGRDLAATPGKVVYRNHLIELIQYAPSTGKVHPEPILITPAWIMKYYILDLSPHNSLVRYLVAQGFTVFMISWRNPSADDRDLSLQDYIRMGFFDALRAVNTIVPGTKVHAMGYCLGGTLLTMAAAAMARDDDQRLQTITLFAAQTDFSEAGEIMLFAGESQVSFLESLMWDQGYLDSHQMAGAFQMLQSNDLIWSRYVNEYLLGRRQEMFDLMAWNADATRMPYKMHSEYLRKLFLENELARGRFIVGEEAVSLSDIKQPIFSVSTTQDHVAPWHSVYKLHLLADTDITFVLANRGHNGGIVSEPGHEGREFQIRSAPEDSKYMPPDEWRQSTPLVEGSWWPALVNWLSERSGPLQAPPSMGADRRGYKPIQDAPGSYVLQR